MGTSLKDQLLGAGGLRTELTRGVIGSVAIKFVNVLLGLAISVILARVLAPEGYGIYAFAMAVMSLLAIPVQVGLPTLIVREVASYQQDGYWSYLRGILRWANRVTIILSLAVGTAAVAVLIGLGGRIDRIQLLTIGWALVLLPLLALNNIRGAVLRGLRRVVLGQIPELLVRPCVFILLLTIFLFYKELSPPQAMALNCASVAAAFLVGLALLFVFFPPETQSIAPEYEKRRWLVSIGPLSLLAGLQFISGQTDIFMLGVLATKQDVGLYRVAYMGASLVVFMLTSVNIVMGPYISRLHNSGDKERLQKMLRSSARFILLAALPVAAVFIVFGKVLLEIIYGAGYIAAYRPLVILCFGQVINAAMGSVGLILNMTGHERETLKGVAVATGINVLLNIALIPRYGSVGAATATAVSIVIWNILLFRAVWVRLGIRSTAI
jgi:O-antigen/teichoic acid export membrane protein